MPCLYITLTAIAMRFSRASGQLRGRSVGLERGGQLGLSGMGMLEGWGGTGPGG